MKSSHSGNVDQDPAERRKRIDEKVKQLDKYVSPQGARGSGKSSTEQNESIASGVIATNLFSKAPIDFLEHKTLEGLAHITTKSIEAINALKPDLNKGCVIGEECPDYTALYITIGDRPFVVNTINECLRNFGLSTPVFLHPILVHQGMRVSLSYVETEKLTKERSAVLIRQLTKALDDLILVTEDFTSMLVRTETLAKVLENPKYRSTFPESEKREVAEFLRWLSDGGFVFLAHAEWCPSKESHLGDAPTSTLGIFKTSQPYRSGLLNESRQDAMTLLNKGELISITRLRTESPVHRTVRMINIVIQELSTEGRLVAIHSLLGMLTSKARSQESSSVPLIRRKLKQLIDLEDVVHNSHDYKYIVDIIDSMPKDEALRMDVNSLREAIQTILGVQHKNETRISIRYDQSRRGVSVLIVMPRDRFNSHVRQRIQNHIESKFGAVPKSSEYHLDYSNKPLVRFYFYVPIAEGDIPPIDLLGLQNEVADLSRTWRDNLKEKITTEHFADPNAIWFKYADAFPENYQALQSVDDCISDIEAMETLDTTHSVKVSMSAAADSGVGTFTIIVYHLGSEITISKALPILENAGLEVINEKSASIPVLGRQPVFIHRFLVRSKTKTPISQPKFSALIGPGLEEIFSEKAENDMLNALMLDANLDTRAISLLRTYCALLWQINKVATRSMILDAVASVPKAAVQLWNMFETRFNHARVLSQEQRNEDFNQLHSGFKDLLRQVKDITKDRILRSLGMLMEHTLRTNFYKNQAAIALKLHSKRIDIMPMPRPLYEIFVRSPIVEGIHLRSGKVARGGIRWSDRTEDYRSEVLGLMNTQTIKNVLIVPEGAKGGFIVRNPPKDSEALQQAVQNSYREFIRSCLSITDNRVKGEICHPDGLIIYDELDPYFVVAADKGTAKFSDTANAVAIKEFDFWLNDAFASGGSRGYDHKIYGITARGAWESVKRHFHDMRFDFTKEPFTVVGIGDMSGDVFGNGLLLSDQAKLIAAFDHRHVFIDPTPDPAISFKERQRMFELPKSSWADYKKELISKGGGVFGRYDKEITVTPEMRAALSIPESIPDVVNGEQLISCTLKAKCDLLWNGGIGTYVKAPSEAHADVNDGTNDRVRVNSDELRAKVVGEGGNLGFTQRARVDFSERGGLMNTDAIDNSGGVDLSDHEVNIKILFAALMRENKLTIEARDKLLVDLAPQVTEFVLEDNRSHALLLSMGVKRSKRNIGYFQSFIARMVKLNYVIRNLDCLPDDDELMERASKKIGLQRPELAICMASAKMWLKGELLKSELLKDPLLKTYLLEYFPTTLQNKYKEEILLHPLAPNIIATQIVNTLVNGMGITFVHRMCLTHSTTPITAIKCALAAEFLLRSKVLRESVQRFDGCGDTDTFIGLRNEISSALRNATSWLISNHGLSLPLDEIVDLYQARYKTLVQSADEVFTGEEKVLYEQRLEKYQKLGVDEFTMKSLAVFPRIIRILEMLSTSRRCRKNITLVATVYSQVLDILGVNTVLKLEHAIETTNKWENELVENSFEEIRRSVSHITGKLLEKNVVTTPEVSKALTESPSYEQLVATQSEVKGNVPIAVLSVIARQLRMFEVKLP